MKFERIWKRENLCLGKPVIKGTRLKVEFILEKLASGYTVDDLLKAYSHLTKEDIVECLMYARALVENESIEMAEV